MAGVSRSPAGWPLRPMLAPSRRLMGDFTISCLSETEFQLTRQLRRAGNYLRWFRAQSGDGVMLKMYQTGSTGFQNAGPHARIWLVPDPRSVDLRSSVFDQWSLARCLLVERVSYTETWLELYWRPYGPEQPVAKPCGKPAGPMNLRALRMRAMMSLRAGRFSGPGSGSSRPNYTAAENRARPVHLGEEDADQLAAQRRNAKRAEPPPRVAASPSMRATPNVTCPRADLA